MPTKLKSSDSINRDTLKGTLEKLTREYENSYGLYNGKTGLCMCYFLLAETENNPDYKMKARALLDELSENIASVQELDFAIGLAGIGWGIEWLVQNNFVDANTDEILGDLDDELYKSVVFAKASSLSLHNGTLGKAMYFYKRLMAQNPDPVRYRVLCNQECLVLLTDEMNETLLNKETGLLSVETFRQNLTPQQITEIAQCLVFLIKLIPLRVNAEITEKLIGAILYYAAKYTDTYAAPNSKEQEDATRYLLHSYLLAGKKLKDREALENATHLLEKLRWKETAMDSNDFYRNYLDVRIEHLLGREKTHRSVPELQSVFEILASVTANKNALLDSWNEAWLLS